jgi:putative tryptophan/tyrosine transport system substrate-binding protein
MRRRDFIRVIIGSAVSWPSATFAQQRDRTRRIGILMPLPETDREGQKSISSFVQGLRELGWSEGGNFHIDYRWTGPDVARISSAAAELVDLRPDAILAMTPLTLVPLQQLTSTIPIVFLQISDPVSSGLIRSLAQPGGNITGLTTSEFSMSGKMLQLFKEVVPTVNRVAVIYNPAQGPQVARLADIEKVAPSLGVQISAAEASNADQITHIIENFASESDGGMIVLPNPITITNRALIIALMARHHLPAAYELPIFARDGGLMAYGADPVAQWHEAATYVDRILKGSKPADLPVQQPTKFELIINLKTAKALGLTIPSSILASADEVIE